MSRILQTFMRRDTYMESQLEIYQGIRTFLVGKKTKTEKKRYYEKCIGLSLEHGFSKKFYRDPPSYIGVKFEKQGGSDGFVHYGGLQDYINANTVVVALPFDKLDYLFRIYLAFVAVILLVNLIHYGLKTLAIRLKIRRFQAWLLRKIQLSGII